MPQTVSDVFFDLDHTLWDFEKNSAIAFGIIFKNNGIGADIDAFLSHYIPINLKYWELYRVEKISQNDLRYGRLKEAFDAIGYQVSDEQVATLSSEYIDHLPQSNHLFDGTIEILDYLKSKYRLHIITNGFAEIQNRKLNNSNIFHYFDTVTNSEIAGVKKPNAIIFEHALRIANARKDQSIMIGDCIDADIRGALNCGMDAILFCPDDTVAHHGVKRVVHLSDLKNYL